MFTKRIGIISLIFAMAASVMTGCGSDNNSSSEKAAVVSSSSASAASEEDNTADTKTNSEKYSVVCTIFPEYDWVKQILGDHADNVELTYLLDNGVDLHSYQPTAEDIVKISTCDLFIYVGGESDEWADDALAESTNKNMKVVELMDVLGDSAKEEEIKEGMQAEEEEEEEGEGEEEPEYDEHIWLSLKNAKVLSAAIESKLAELDPSNASDYKANLDSYTAKLDELDKSFKELVDKAPVKTLVFGDRFPFRYFADDYGLDYYAAFVGCSAETEASFETVAFLAGKIKDLDCKTIFTLENSDKSIAETVINTSGKDVEIAELNSLQSVSKDDVSDGATYLSLMQKNYDVLSGVLK